MIIYVKDFSFRTHTFEVEPTDKLEDLQDKIRDETGIPAEEQRLLYAGKQLETQCTLSDYSITGHSTIHLVQRPKNTLPRSHIPTATAFPTEQEAHERTTKWAKLADEGNFDADTHIVDPNAHYAVLDSLQKTVVKSSELYRQSGVYKLGSSGKATDLQHLTRESTAPEWINNLVLDLQQDGDLAASSTVVSLCETYFIILSVVENFDLLKSKQFCTSFFSILVEQYEGTVAEIVKISREVLILLKDSFESAITFARFEETDPESIREVLKNCVEPAIQEFLALLKFPQPGTDIAVSNTAAEMLNLYRMVACILDLGLVCYVGSHGARFDTEYFQREMNPLRFDLPNRLSFDCSLRNLACLDGFLDAKSVWVIRAGFNLSPALSQVDNRNQKKLFILTTIDALADVWGHVWAETGDQIVTSDKPERIKKYHVSKGVIRRVRGGTDATIPGAIKCHWYSWTQDYRRRFSTLFTKTEDLTMARNDNLLIGDDIRVNPQCTYTLQTYEMNYGDVISSLGSKPSTWRLDGAALAVQLAAPKVIAFQIQGNVRKIPETTIKQFTWEKWSFAPERANPGILNNHFGVEISHCTGNARRVPLKDILLMEPMRELLERQIPKWSSTLWGSAFQKALQSESNDAIFNFWRTHVADRPLVGKLVSSVLDVLDSTGKTDSGFRAAFLHQNRELGVDIDSDKNDWAAILKDSYLMATYAIVNEVCLECRQPDHTTSTCGDESQYTVLQTRVEVKKDSRIGRNEQLKRLKVEPHSKTYRKVYDELAGRRVQHFITPESSIKRTLLMNHNLTVAKELLDSSPSWGGNKHATEVMIRASGKSYGGMDYRRDRTMFSSADNTTDCEMGGMGQPGEPLSQLEIEAIIRDGMQGEQTESGNIVSQSTVGETGP